MLKFTSHKFFSLVAVMLLGIAIALSLSGCRQKAAPISGSLLQIDSLLQSNPDSAYSLLVNVNFDSLPGDRDKNFYRLLMVEAQDKTFRDDTVYKDISAAAEYFDSIGDRRNAMRSLFYQGRIFQNRHEYGNAIISMLKAEEKADSTEHLYLGKIYNAISEAYKEVSDAPQELKYARKALEEYEQLDSVPFVNDAKLWLGLSLCRNNQPKEGIAMMTNVYECAHENNDNPTAVAALQYLSLGYLWTQDNQKAKHCLSILCNQHNNYVPDYYSLYLIELIITQSPPDSIEIITKNIRNNFSENIISHEYYEYKNEYKSAYYALLKESFANDSMFVNRLNSNVALAIDMQHSKEKLKADVEIKMLNSQIRNISVFVALVIVLITLLVYIWSLSRSKKEKDLLYSLEIIKKEKSIVLEENSKLYKDKELLKQDNDRLTNSYEHLINKNESLSNNNEDLIKEKAHLISQYKILRQKNKELQGKLQDYITKNRGNCGVSLLETFFKNLDLLHTDYYINVNTEKAKSMVLNHVADQLKWLREDLTVIENIESYIDILHDNLLSDIYGKLKLNPEQRRIVALLCLNFSKEAICQIMDLSMSNYYTRLNRLMKRIEATDCQRKEDLITLIRGEKKLK